MARKKKAQAIPKNVAEIREGYVLFCPESELFLEYNPFAVPAYSWVPETRYMVPTDKLESSACMLLGSAFQHWLEDTEAKLVYTIGYYGPEVKNKAGDGFEQSVFFEIDFRYSFDIWEEITKIPSLAGEPLISGQEIGRGLRTGKEQMEIEEMTKVISSHNRLDAVDIFKAGILNFLHVDWKP